MLVYAYLAYNSFQTPECPKEFDVGLVKQLRDEIIHKLRTEVTKDLWTAIQRSSKSDRVQLDYLNHKDVSPSIIQFDITIELLESSDEVEVEPDEVEPATGCLALILSCFRPKG